MGAYASAHLLRYHPIFSCNCREQTEGEYSAIEHESVKGVVECLKVVTAHKSHRIAKFAFDYATRHGRKKVRNQTFHTYLDNLNKIRIYFELNVSNSLYL